MTEIVSDTVVIGLVGTGACGSIILFILLVHFVVATTRKKIEYRIKYCALLSLVCSLMFCLGAALWRTNIIFDLNFNSPNGGACTIGFGVHFAFYALSKIFLYLLFTFRIETVFQASAYKMNSTALFICRAILTTLALLFIIGVVGYLPKIEARTRNGNILLCTGDTGLTANIGDISIVAGVFLDIIVTALLVFLFVYKLRQV